VLALEDEEEIKSIVKALWRKKEEKNKLG